MAWLLQQADLLLTDSGGLQEEAPSLGLRTLVLREATERPEAIDCGLSQLVDLSADAIYKSVIAALALPRPAPSFPFGDGEASAKIARIVASWLHQQPEEVAVSAVYP